MMNYAFAGGGAFGQNSFGDCFDIPGFTDRAAVRVSRAFLLYRLGGNSAVRETRKKRAVATEFTGRRRVILIK